MTMLNLCRRRLPVRPLFSRDAETRRIQLTEGEQLRVALEIRGRMSN